MHKNGRDEQMLLERELEICWSCWRYCRRVIGTDKFIRPIQESDMAEKYVALSKTLKYPNLSAWLLYKL